MTEPEHGHVILYSYLWRENSIAWPKGSDDLRDGSCRKQGWPHAASAFKGVTLKGVV
ncbi:hypothetical protein [Mesorhizobium japonicum]|uniref:hypothetical protein n=1 Tax=Mesorhizobium japonicum TaxID=2066070 RepID=UPI0012FEA0C5|nr:hypothetical protein [Mesorhizobium japonicum]